MADQFLYDSGGGTGFGWSPTPIGENGGLTAEELRNAEQAANVERARQAREWGGTQSPGVGGGQRYNPYVGWGMEDWARQLKSPANMNAAQLEDAIRRGWITPEMANDALITKDAWLRRSQQQSTRGGYGYNQWTPQGISNPTGQPPPTWNPTFTPLAGDFNQPTDQVRIEDVNMYGVAPEARGGIYDWLQGQGFQGRGSLGQYGYRKWQRQNPYEFNAQAIQAIPDERLRGWAMKLFGKG